MMTKKLITIYLLLIAFHAMHIAEEILGNASFITSFYKNVETFGIISAILFAIPLVVFYFMLRKKRWALTCSYAYAAIMIIDGISHLITQEAGRYTSSGLIIFGLLLVYFLRKEETRT